MTSVYGSVQRQDWNDRDFIEIISRNIKKITDFLNHFDQSCRGKLAELNEKVTQLERQMDFLEACINGAATNHSASVNTADQFSPRDSYSALARLMASQRPMLQVIRSAPKTTSTTSEKAKSMEPTSAVIAEYYGLAINNKLGQQQGKFSQSDLNKVRASQRQEIYQVNRRIMYEKIALNSYLNVCIDVGQINRAFNTLLKLAPTNKGQLIDVNHYNIILKGWAKLASIGQILETRMHMIRCKIEPNAESFVYILLGYAKGPENRRSNVRRIIHDMKARDIKPDQLFHHAYLDPSERKLIKNLLRQYDDPAYDDTFCDEPIEYKCKLLKDFESTDWRPYHFSGTSDLSRIEAWADNQRTVENKTSVSIKSIASCKESPAQIERTTKIWQKLVEIWRESLTVALDQSLEALQNQSEDPTKIHLYPYLRTIDKTMIVNLMLDEVELNAAFSNYSTSTSTLHLNLGNKVMTRYLKLKAIEDGSHSEEQKIYIDYLKNYLTDANLMGEINSRQYIQERAKETKNYAIYKDKLNSIEEWPHHIAAAVGRLLYGLILREVKFDPTVLRGSKRDINMKNLVHAFYTAYFQIDCSHKIKEEFRAHQDFEKLFDKSSSLRLRFDYSFLPSLSPPMPWLSRRLGGYLTNRTNLVRIQNQFAEQAHVVSMSSDNQKLYPSFDSLNAISLCPWIVNEDILDLVIKLFQSGGDAELNVPLEESKMIDNLPVLKKDPSKADRLLFNREMKRHDQKRREMYSLWRDCLYRLSIANHFRDKIFWFPHNMDFRGRTYPIPPHFNHLGADLARSLLLFARGEPLGEHGLDWLKLHLINLVGTMKSKSLSERLDYANSIIHLEVMDSADNPWDGRRWWTRNECPWQVLACCKEIAKAIRSRDHRQYISHFPVHQDGSCNGLQHYAALGRDPSGAMAVNLVPCDKPQDVYSRVVEIVEEMRKKDAERGVKVAQMLDGFIQRKVIKQTVMTTVYGVTKYGARNQIARQLNNKGYNEREIWMSAQYLASKTFESIGKMFNKSRLIQDWFNDCAFIIASRCRQHVSWETPLGFPITQPYTVATYSNLSRLLSPTIDSKPNQNCANSDPRMRLNSSKQKTAFPPNYIHSLDSSHMMLTSIHCQRQGLTFVSVHDCYWTHPSTVDVMNKICRQQFIALHSEPLLKDLSEQFIERYGKSLEIQDKQGPRESSKNNNNNNNNKNTNKPLIEMLDSIKDAKQIKARATFADVPTTGDLDLNLVQDSTYFFS